MNDAKYMLRFGGIGYIVYVFLRGRRRKENYRSKIVVDKSWILKILEGGKFAMRSDNGSWRKSY